MENQNALRTTGWVSGFLLRKPSWPAPSDQIAPRYACLSPGEIGPVTPSPTWFLRLGSPEQWTKEDCRICCEGIRLASSAPVDVVLGPQGSLIGFSHPAVTPNLFSLEGEVESIDEEIQSVSVEGGKVLLLVMPAENGHAFALLPCTEENQETTTELLYRVIRQIEPRDELDQAFARRDAILPRQNKEDAAATLALEVLISKLRPRNQRIPSRWAASTADGQDIFLLNDTLIQALTWVHIDSQVTIDLLAACIATQRPDGLLPASITPDGSIPPSSVSAWPILGQVCLEYYRRTHDFSIFEEITSQLHSYTQALQDAYQSDLGGPACWPSPEDALVPELWDEGLASTDLTTLLILDIDALLELFSSLSSSGIDVTTLQATRSKLEAGLIAHFWNPPEHLFIDRYLHGEDGSTPGAFIRRSSLGSYLPLAIRDLNPGYRDALVTHLNSASGLLTEDGFQHWQSWEDDEEAPAIDTRVQALALVCLRNHPPTLLRLQTNLLQSQLRLFSDGRAFPRDLRVSRNEDKPPIMDAAYPELEASAAALYLLAGCIYADTADSIEVRSAPIRFLERHRRAVVNTVIALFLVILLGVPFFVIRQSSQRGVTMYLRGTDAETAFKMGDFLKSAELYATLSNDTADIFQKARYQGYAARAFFYLEDYPNAIEWYSKVVNIRPEDSKAQLNLGLSYFHNRNYSESYEALQKARELTGENEPLVAEKATEALKLIQPRLHQNGEP